MAFHLPYLKHMLSARLCALHCTVMTIRLSVKAFRLSRVIMRQRQLTFDKYTAFERPVNSMCLVPFLTVQQPNIIKAQSADI